jgi:dUTP pyrophosphatase
MNDAELSHYASTWTEKPTLKIVRVGRGRGSIPLPVPKYQTTGASGMDLYADTADKSMCIIPPGEKNVICTGIAVEIQAGYEGQIRSRSGLAAKSGVVVLNSPGTIDSDYRGEIKVILVNHSKENYIVSRGDRIAQMVICPVTQVEIVEVEELDITNRGSGGLGSTGK